MTALVVRPRVPRADITFRALGTDVRLVAEGSDAMERVAEARAEVHALEARLSRFRPDSDLCALNGDPRPVVHASPELRAAVAAALHAAARSRGLVDPCLLDALEAAGYRHSFVPTPGGPPPVPGGPGAPAAPHPRSRWRAVAVDDVTGTIRRPPGLRLDLGGTGKGFVADRLAVRLGGGRWVADLGGDLRVGGRHEVHVAHPQPGRPPLRVDLADAAVATSGLVRRAWRGPGGARAHHLLDPATGAPAWAGLLAATAVAPTTLEAEIRAKVAVLSGAARAREVLAADGGVLVHADGTAEPVGALA